MTQDKEVTHKEHIGLLYAISYQVFKDLGNLRGFLMRTCERMKEIGGYRVCGCSLLEYLSYAGDQHYYTHVTLTQARAYSLRSDNRTERAN